MALVFFSVGPKNNILWNMKKIISLLSIGIAIEYVFDKNMSVEKKFRKIQLMKIVQAYQQSTCMSEDATILFYKNTFSTSCGVVNFSDC